MDVPWQCPCSRAPPTGLASTVVTQRSVPAWADWCAGTVVCLVHCCIPVPGQRQPQQALRCTFTNEWRHPRAKRWVRKGTGEQMRGLSVAGWTSTASGRGSKAFAQGNLQEVQRSCGRRDCLFWRHQRGGQKLQMGSEDSLQRCVLCPHSA